MGALFWTLWVIDLLVWAICAYETFFTRSNSSLAIPTLILTICLGVSWWMQYNTPKWALVVAGIPAGLVLLFVLVWLISMMGRNNWQ